LFDVLEGIIHETTIATLISKTTRAIDQVGLGETNQFTSSKSVLSFHRSGGGERPAGTTLTLVLDWCHNALGPPINACGKSRDINVDDVVSSDGLSCWLYDAEVISRKLLVGKISEFVHCHGIAKAERVVGVDYCKVLGPSGVSEEGLLQTVVGLVKSVHPVGECQVLDDGDGGNISQNQSN